MSLELEGVYENLDEINKRLKIIEAVISDTRGTRFDNPVEARLDEIENRLGDLTAAVWNPDIGDADESSKTPDED